MSCLSHIWGAVMNPLSCVSCLSTFQPQRGLYTCPKCGPLLGTLEVQVPCDSLKGTIRRSDFRKRDSLFQFRTLLPVQSHTPVDQAVGGTPLLSFKGVLGLETLLIKNDGMSLSASYKDRASVVAMNLAIEGGYDTIYCASTGNAASSLAILTAHSPLNTVIFVPETIPRGKLAQLQAAGAQVYLISGSYDEAFDLSMQIGMAKGWYCRNSAVNPYLLEGKKTAAYEILVQNDYEVPDFCLVGVGDGTVVSSLIKGFEEFRQLGLVDRVPTVIGVQAEGASTLKKVFESGEPYTPLRETVSTVADSISVGYPRDVIKACCYMARSGGCFTAVADQDIIWAMSEMTRTTGVFAEPAGAAPFAALHSLIRQGLIHREDAVVLVVTGSGLKDPRAIESGIDIKSHRPKDLMDSLLGA